jgi:hypothetical protein
MLIYPILYPLCIVTYSPSTDLLSLSILMRDRLTSVCIYIMRMYEERRYIWIGDVAQWMSCRMVQTGIHHHLSF